MKRQRNTTQMKEQTWNTEIQTNEEKIGKLTEKEFRIMIVKMIKHFEKHFISPSILNEILAGYSNLGCRFYTFSALNIFCRSLLAGRVSAERSTVKHMGFPLYVTCCFSLATFNILSLYLVFASLVSMCLSVFLLGFILYGALCASWTWLTISISTFGKFSTITSSKIFSYPFFFSFWDP